MLKADYVPLKTIRITDKKLYAGIQDFAAKGGSTFTSAMLTLVRHGLTSFDRAHMNSAENLADMREHMMKLSDDFENLSETVYGDLESLVTASNEDRALIRPVLEILIELQLVSRLELKNKYPQENTKRQELVAGQIAILREYAKECSGRNSDAK